MDNTTSNIGNNNIIELKSKIEQLLLVIAEKQEEIQKNKNEEDKLKLQEEIDCYQKDLNENEKAMKELINNDGCADQSLAANTDKKYYFGRQPDEIDLHEEQPDEFGIDEHFYNCLEKLYSELEKEKSIEKLVLPKFEIISQGKNNFIFKNVKDVLRIINRPPKEHFIPWLANELKNTEVSLVSPEGSVRHGIRIKGRIDKKPQEKIMELMKKYVIKYVICNSCGSNESIIEKNQNTRKWVFTCDSCKTNYSLD